MQVNPGKVCTLLRILVLWVQWLIKVSLAGQINRAINGYLSAGQMFLVSLLYAGSVLLNLLTCFW